MTHRPEHREIDPTADGVVNLGGDFAGSKNRLRCTRCRPDVVHTVPVRYDDDPKTVVRCAGCGKKHSPDSIVVV